MANITREYGLAQAIQFILKNEDSVTTTETINNGEDFGKIKYNLVEGGQYPYIELQLEHMAFWEWWGEKSYNLTPLLAKIYFDDVEREDIENGCFYINLARCNVISDGVPPLIQTNINQNYHILFGFAYTDSDGENHIIDITHQRVQRGTWQKAVAGRVDIMTDSFYSALGSLSYLESSGKIASNFPLAETLGGALRYLKTGDESDLLNGGDEPEEEIPAEDRTTVLYYNDRVSVTTFGFNDTTDYFTHSIQFKIQYKTNAGEKITEPRNSIVGYVKSSVDPVTFSNIEWVYNKNVKIVECKWSYGLVGGTKHTGTKPPDNIPDIMCFYDQTQIDNKVYKAKFGTNMVIFANKSDAERFAEGDKTVRPLYDGHSGRFDDTGDIGDKYSYNTQSYTIDNDMSSVWILTKEQLNELASVLATGLTKSEAESGQTLLNITKTTARSFTAQAEPVDMICDLFWVPIDVSEFCITHTDHLQFGQDTYGAAGALDEFVDETTGQVVKAARTSSRSIEALTGGIFETIGSAVSDSKLNVRSESVTPPPSNT